MVSWTWWMLFIFLAIFVNDGVNGHWGWGRRRRRRRRYPPPPPEPDCFVSAWSSWSTCSRFCSVGTQSRARHITYRPSTFCIEPSLRETRWCGVTHGGCAHNCDNTNHICTCRSGYILMPDGKGCQDVNECSPNGGKGPCSHTCTNNAGSFACSCPHGYYLHTDARTCYKKSCQILSLPNCLNPMLPGACKKVTVTCSDGNSYDSHCYFSCPTNFGLAKIINKALPFAKNIFDADFQGLTLSTVCRESYTTPSITVWRPGADTFKDYYCRRTNDPPTSIAISATNILEHTPINTTIATVSASDVDQVSFTIRQSSGFFFFRIQGNKLTNTWVPRWRNLQGLEINHYHLIIRATDNGHPSMWSEKNFTITVVNVNDPPYSIRLSNNSVLDTAPISHVIGTLSAIDYDGPRGSSRSSDFHWSLVDSDQGRFTLGSTSGSSLVVASSLASQAHRTHRIVVQCTDKDATNPRFAQATLFINVVNTNDSPKHIKFEQYKLFENATAGFIVGRLVAVDQDGDVISFSMSQSPSISLGAFRLGTTLCRNVTLASGIRQSECAAYVVLKKQLNYELKSSYSLKVMATDPSGSFALKEFTIVVLDLNEYPTDIVLSSLIVAENSPADTIVAQITVVDPDIFHGSPQQHTCTVSPSSPFIINGLNLVVARNAALDFEQKSLYVISITCTDAGIPLLSLSKVFNIRIRDVNEPPTYLRLSNLVIPENARSGTVVGVFTSADPDGWNTKLTYQIQSPNVPFAIGGSGNDSLVTTSQLDYETTKQYDISVSVTDDGGLFLEKIFQIRITDVNEAPTDVQLSSSVLRENSPANTFIGSITVIDPDADSNVSCIIVDGHTEYLAVNGFQLVVGSKRVDYESLDSRKRLNFKLKCSDQHGLYIEKVFHVTVTDVNEPPTDIEITVQPVMENIVGAKVGNITVKDPDVSQRHVCSIVVNNTLSSVFTVNSATMEVVTLKGLNFEIARRHSVIIRCIDQPLGNQMQFTIFKDIFVDVIDVNEAPLDPCPSIIYVDEATSSGAVVWTFKPRDPDNEEYELAIKLGITSYLPKQIVSLSMEQNAAMPFSIAGGKFLVMTGTLNRQQQSIYNVIVEAKDDGMLIRKKNGNYIPYQGVPKSSIYYCKAEILATGDHRLSLSIALSSNVISEDAANGTVIGNLTMINGVVGETYTLRIVNRERPFRIVNNQLILVGGASLDYEETNSTGVSILAVGSKGNSVQRLFLIEIKNVNEKPVRMCLLGNHTVPELQPAGQVIGRIVIEDPDQKETIGICSRTSGKVEIRGGSRYICSIESNDGDISKIRSNFLIDKNLTLRSNETFVYRVKKSYAVPITCTDVNKPIHLIKMIATIKVIDVNERPTNLCLLNAKSVIPEKSSSDTALGQIAIEDPDHPESIGICKKPTTSVSQYLLYTCSISSTGVNADAIKSKFYVDQHFYLHRNGDFNYKIQKSYHISIICKDKLNPSLSIEKTFTINIQAPTCTPPRILSSNSECVCPKGRTGSNCERYSNICNTITCARFEVCVSHVKCTTRCIPPSNQIPVLLRQSYVTVSVPENQYKIEAYVESILEGTKPAGQTLSSIFPNNVVNRRRRDLPKDVYVEASMSQSISTYTYVIFVTMDPSNKYTALPWAKICPLLNGTDVRCVNEEDCKLLERYRVHCPFKFGTGANGGTSGSGTDAPSGGTAGKSKSGDDKGKPWMYGLGSSLVIAVAIVVLIVFLLKRRTKKKKSDDAIRFSDLQEDSFGEPNPLYGISPENSPPRTVSKGKRSFLPANSLSYRNNQQTGMVFNNDLYGKQNNIEIVNPAYGKVPRQRPNAGAVAKDTGEHIYDSVGKFRGKEFVDLMSEEESLKEKEKQFVDLPPRAGKFPLSKKVQNKDVNVFNETKEDADC